MGLVVFSAQALVFQLVLFADSSYRRLFGRLRWLGGLAARLVRAGQRHAR